MNTAKLQTSNTSPVTADSIDFVRLTISSQDKIITDLSDWNECALLNALPCIQDAQFISKQGFLGFIGALHSHKCLY